MPSCILRGAIQPARDRETVLSHQRRRQQTRVCGGCRSRRPGAGLRLLGRSLRTRAKYRRVDESWPTTGIPKLLLLDHTRPRWSACSIASRSTTRRFACVRLRPALVFKREAASGVRRLFAGPPAAGDVGAPPSLIPVVPAVKRLVVQAVHGDDLGHAYRPGRRAGRAAGAFNVAAEPALDCAGTGPTARRPSRACFGACPARRSGILRHSPASPALGTGLA